MGSTRLGAETSRLYFFFNDTATTEIYTLSLHDALPIFDELGPRLRAWRDVLETRGVAALLEVLTASGHLTERDRKSTRLNSSHANISYAVFCLKKKKRPTRFT